MTDQQTPTTPWSKGGYASLHAQKRVRERFGRNLPPEVSRRMVDHIHSGKAVFIAPGKGKDIAIFAVLLDDKAVPVVYNKQTKTIVTVMHRGSILSMLNKRLRQLAGESYAGHHPDQ